MVNTLFSIIPTWPECSIAPILPLWAIGHSESTHTSDQVCGARYQSRSLLEWTTKLQHESASAANYIHTNSVFTSNSCNHFQIPCDVSVRQRDARWNECMSVCQHSLVGEAAFCLFIGGSSIYHWIPWFIMSTFFFSLWK